MGVVTSNKQSIREHIICFLEVFEPVSEAEIIFSFKYRNHKHTIQSILRQLELNGSIVYLPKQRAFVLPHNRRTSA